LGKPNQTLAGYLPAFVGIIRDGLISVQIKANRDILCKGKVGKKLLRHFSKSFKYK